MNHKQITLQEMIKDVEEQRNEQSKKFALSIIRYTENPTDGNKARLIEDIKLLHKLIRVNNNK